MANNPRNKDNLKPFKKGETGNANGRPKKIPAIDELLAEVLGKEKDGKTVAQAILSALSAKALKGDIRAAEVLLNRGYGLPKQHIKNENTGSIKIEIIRTKIPNAIND